MATAGGMTAEKSNQREALRAQRQTVQISPPCPAAGEDGAWSLVPLPRATCHAEGHLQQLQRGSTLLPGRVGMGKVLRAISDARR